MRLTHKKTVISHKLCVIIYCFKNVYKVCVIIYCFKNVYKVCVKLPFFCVSIS